MTILAVTKCNVKLSYGRSFSTDPSIFAHDYPAIQGAILFIAISVVVINLFVDLTYAKIDPRLRDTIK